MSQASFSTIDPEIASRFKTLLDQEQGITPDAPAGTAPPAERRPNALAVPSESDTPEDQRLPAPTFEQGPVIPDEDAGEEADGETAEVAPPGPEGGVEEMAEEAIETFAELAQSYEVDEQELLDALTIEGRNGEPTTLADVVTGYREGVNVEGRVASGIAEAEKGLRSEHDARMQELQRTTARLVAELNQEANIDWPTLRRDNPGEFLRLSEERQAREAVVNQGLEAMQAETDRREAEDKENHGKWKTSQVDLLFKLRPTWRDEKVGSAAMDEVSDYMRVAGFAKDQIENLEDALSVQTVWEAAQYRKSQAKNPAIRKKLSRLPRKTLRPSARDETAPARAASKERSQQLDRARESGKIEDLQAFFGEHTR